MANPIPPIPDGDIARESDYGSDFSAEEEGIVNQLLESIGSGTASSVPTGTVSPDTSASALGPIDTTLQTDIDAAVAVPDSFVSSPSKQGDQHHGSLPVPDPRLLYRPEAGMAKTPAAPRRTRNSDSVSPRFVQHPPRSMPLDGVQYPDLSHALSKIDPVPTPTPENPPRPEPADDTRTPLQRFRSFPRKPLTVSDLSSGAWCELQYWYTLTRLPGGRKTRTAAMKGGSRVHQTLEDQVHTTVRVDIAIKEEAFALRLWNIIQGLRTLRDTGMTRELEVWGIIDGQVVNGVIDELSHKSPNTGFEQELSLTQQQLQITDYLEPHHRKVYLTDVKTRNSDRLPSGAALRPARVQLFLYHRLLEEMASGSVDYSAIIDRYGLKAEARFSDAFMAQVSDLHDEVFYDAGSEVGGVPSTPRSPHYGPGHAYPDSSPDLAPQTSPSPDLIRYRSIQQMLPLLHTELQNTFPRGAASLGDLLAVQYRHRDDGRIIGNNTFPNDPEALERYMKRNLEWWRGSRAAEGVTIEETYKCRFCEFSADCQWRKDKEAEFLQKRRDAAKAAC